MIYDSEKSYNPSEINLKILFHHSGSGSKNQRLGRYQLCLIPIMIFLITANGMLFFGFQTVLVNDPKEFKCPDETSCKVETAHGEDDCYSTNPNFQESCLPIAYFQNFKSSVVYKFDLMQ